MIVNSLHFRFMCDFRCSIGRFFNKIKIYEKKMTPYPIKIDMIFGRKLLSFVNASHKSAIGRLLRFPEYLYMYINLI